MKNHPSRRSAGFTLVELLVVIAIIAVLAGAGFSAGLAAIQRAKKTTALATCTAIEAAVNNFYTEYGAMPVGSSTADVTYDTKANLDFVTALLGTETSTTPQNTRGIKFLSLKDGKAKGTGGFNGAVYNTAGTTLLGVFDPWGGTYSVRLDGDYDEAVTVQPKAATSSVKLNSRRAAAWSDGADGVTATGKSTDDVKTW